MFDKCLGAANIRMPTLTIKKCPECSAEVEIFSTGMKAECDNYGFTIYTDLQSCIQWCKYAKKCLREELYKKVKRGKST